ncbi:ATP-grasp domain-containing protein [Myroides odoratimimus]|uniref:ATP-grasp domain-containing protein n=1 Tax=Myroides odoratimimus TaxID=76832 RepID=UPI002DBC28E0|nr:ATP-grasp domain-containing protein [Myroides odoratimimus]MEC4044001.1 ATP-grasp domain-containing protein [Myroides odoratimimus]MEC4151831.1 ATP-grasp domain-containing protein [Myroides odoratimimus]
MKNILFCSVGRRGKLLQNFKEANKEGKVLATDCSPYAPALYFADKHFIGPRISDPNYLDFIFNLCKVENVKAITTVIDPEIEILAENRAEFLKRGVLPLCPSKETAAICFDKFRMFEYLRSKGINTVLTYDSIVNFEKGIADGAISFPVFIKPRTGSGSVGATKVHTMADLREKIENSDVPFIIQELMVGEDLDADVYVDCISNKPVSIFTKRKLSTTIGGANKTVSFKDQKLFDFVKEALKHFEFYGPIDVDFFYVNGEYYLSEVNPRFGGAYLHAYGAGIDFVKLILNNIDGIENQENIGDYEEDVVMMMYDNVVIKKKSEM